MFKLVRIDTEEDNEIQLPEGTYLIGRDKLIGFDDKRISWNHGLIFVKGNSVTIESSQRKLYLTKKGSKEKEVLNKTFKTSLEIGDRFGFLSESFWYEVQSSGDYRVLKETNVNTLKSPHFTMEQSSALNHSLEEEKPKKRKKESLKSGNRKLKRRKQSEEEVSELSESDKSSVSDEEENSSSPALKRERCKYGADCYSLRTLRRDNPAYQAHTAEYSHPRDKDWGSEDLRMCPLGAACLRQGPRHARRFKHPAGHRIPPPVPRTKANKCWRRHTIYSESDSDSPERHIVLRSKRQRKPLPKEDVEDESEGEEDPFASDGSEDWRPDEKDFWF